MKKIQSLFQKPLTLKPSKATKKKMKEKEEGRTYEGN